VALTTAPVTFNQDIKALVVDDRFDAEFLLYWLELRGPDLLRLADVANHGTKRMPSELLFASPVARPPVEEQRVLVTTLQALDARREAETVYLTHARTAKSALMSVLLTGELRVTPDEETA
jgi:type I restriction enzyme S subunit